MDASTPSSVAPRAAVTPALLREVCRSRARLDVLLDVARHPLASASDVASRTRMPMSATLGALRGYPGRYSQDLSLVRAGLVERRLSRSVRKRHAYVLTATGAEALRALGFPAEGGRAEAPAGARPAGSLGEA